MAIQEAKTFCLDNPVYIKAYKELRELETRIKLKREIQFNLEVEFGEIINPNDQTVSYKPFHELDLFNHCGEVSKITQETVQGKIKQKIIKGKKPILYFIDHFGREIEIASGDKEAIHLYVVDNRQMVWDPITKMWGTVSEEDYLKKIENNQEMRR